MYQMGLKGNSSVAVDDLFYKYLPNSNKLKYVTDAVSSAGSKLGDFQETVQNNTDNKVSDKADYIYDPNGNLSYDDNKAISSITYNYLNLPSVITITGKGTISYTYDASGNKLRKITTENKSVSNKDIETTTTTDYIGGLVYESKSDNNPNTADYANRLQFGGMEEGRIRAIYANAQTPDLPTNFVYDYFLKDHLGNVRMVLTEEQQQDIYPAATLETNLVATEGSYYTIDPTKIVANSTATGIPAYVNNNGIATNNPGCTGTVCTTDNSQKVYRMNGNENKTGLGITLKVMAGDKVDIFGKSYYFQNNAGGSAANIAVPLLDLLTGFLGGSMGSAVTGAHGAVTAAQINTSAGVTGINTMLTSQTTQSNTAPVVPKAFINYIFFDEQFKAVGSGFSQVNPTGSLKDHHNDAVLQNINVPKNGFVYIYCSNESPVNVFFDNLQVVMTRGAILKETHYYPFGLTISGISSKAAGKAENKYKFNGKEWNSKEFSDGSGLEYLDFGARNYDPQIGRWFNQDKFADVYIAFTPYQYAANNPIKNIDEAGHLLKDKDGNIIATSNGMAPSITRTSTMADGSRQSIRIDMESVTIYTDAGTPVQALRAVKSYVASVTRDANGKDVVGQYAEDKMYKNFRSNCHGYALADGNLWIGTENEQSSLRTILADEYTGNSNGSLSLIEWTDSNGDQDIVHSGMPNADGTYNQKDDIGIANPNASRSDFTEDGNRTNTQGGQRQISERSYNRKSDTNKTTNQSSFKNAAAKGVRITDPEEIKKILTELGWTGK